MSNKSAFFNNELRSQLRKTWAKTLGLRLASGLVTFLALASWVFVLVVLWTASTGDPPLWQTLAVSRAAFGISAGLFLIFIVYPLIRVPGVGKLALAVEGRKDFHDIVALPKPTGISKCFDTAFGTDSCTGEDNYTFFHCHKL